MSVHRLRGPGRVHRVTGEERYLTLCRFFIEQRGQSPNYYEQEARDHGRPFNPRHLVHYQAHLPVMQQQDAQGHAVRAMYLCCGLVDLAAATGDQAMFDHARQLWRSIVDRRMYITGGVGSTAHGERFTFDYDLPNETAYAETCAAIGLVFLAHRLLQVQPRAEYADIVELALHNGVLSGVNLRGDRFFYANPLRASQALRDFPGNRHVFHERQPWFDTSCCPPNLARLLASLGGYLYATQGRTLYVHQYIASQVTLDLAGQRLPLQMTTQYPWDGQVRLVVQPGDDAGEGQATRGLGRWTLALRRPGWCPQVSVAVNGQPVDAAADEAGYLRLTRDWHAGDEVTLTLAMPIQRQYAHPACRMNQGRTALRRGPVIHCVEEADLGFDPSLLLLSDDAPLTTCELPDLLPGARGIAGQALRLDATGWRGGLYDTTPMPLTAAPFRAIPYALWCNRQAGAMSVWLGERR